LKPRPIAELLLLAAIWGASFLFIRLSVSQLGPVPLAFARVLGATALLLPLLVKRGEWSALQQHAPRIAVVGLMGTAVPFMLFGVAALALSAGTLAIFNATTPVWGALITFVWLGERFTRLRVLGMVISFLGVAWLVWDNITTRAASTAVSPIVAALAGSGAALCYGFSAAFTRKYLQGVPAMAMATGSQITATVVLAIPAFFLWPSTPISGLAWLSVLALAVLCTGVAYVLYFRLIAHMGASQTANVTFLIPFFAAVWGVLFLDEPITAAMVVAGSLILLGTSLSTGMVKAKGPSQASTKITDP
jgi:drug/metabolite transporter (DMT)-like permease